MNISKRIYIITSVLSVFTVCLILVLTGCKTSSTPKREVSRSVYFWKSVFWPSPYEKATLARLGVDTMYVKFFDVDWDPQKNIAFPVAVLRIADQDYFSSKQIIPVVFITNQCLHQIDSADCKPLAEKITTLLKNIGNAASAAKTREIQIDCDWTEKTKDKYFYLLRTLKQLSPQIAFSATIRLYQVKFAAKTGVPPVSRGMLMCYNMGNLRDPSARNSILVPEELEKYTAGLAKYPLPLDVAFPIFSWAVLLRNGSYAGLLQNLPEGFFDNPVFKNRGNRYEVLSDTLLTGYEMKKGDVLRMEESRYADVMNAVKIINDQLPAGEIRVSLYHLDSLTLSKYRLNELETLYDGMR